jgi:hypothetical protein
VVDSIIKQTERKEKSVASIALAIVRAMGMAKAVSIPIIKMYACKSCSSLASVSFDTDTNRITVKKCKCN